MIAAGDGNVDALDPDFKIPSVWKSGAGLDYAFDIPGLGAQGKNAELKLNYTFSKAMNAVMWQDLRRDSSRLPGAAGANNLPVGVRCRTGATATPTTSSPTAASTCCSRTRRTATATWRACVLQKGFPFGLFVSGSYAWQDVHEVNPGTSSRSV